MEGIGIFEPEKPGVISEYEKQRLTHIRNVLLK